MNTGARSGRAGRRTLIRAIVFLVFASSLVAQAPDAYWCPMHPGVRAPAPGKCPLCAMALVPIRPPSSGEYHMDVGVTAGPHGRGLSGLRLSITNPIDGAPLLDLVTVHEKPLHVFIIS